MTEIRRFLEPGPIVLVSTAWQGETNIMTMGWHTVMEFSRECVINVPTEDLASQVVGIGNSSGRDIDKFAVFELTAVPGSKVKAPLIDECYANLECKLVALGAPAALTGEGHALLN